MSSAPKQSRNQDKLAASQNDPRYPVLQQALDNYVAKRQKAEGFSGISLHVSLTATGSALDLASGSTSFRIAAPSLRTHRLRLAASLRASRQF